MLLKPYTTGRSLSSWRSSTGFSRRRYATTPTARSNPRREKSHLPLVGLFSITSALKHAKISGSSFSHPLQRSPKSQDWSPKWLKSDGYATKNEIIYSTMCKLMLLICFPTVSCVKTCLACNVRRTTVKHLLRRSVKACMEKAMTQVFKGFSADEYSCWNRYSTYNQDGKTANAIKEWQIGLRRKKDGWQR